MTRSADIGVVITCYRQGSTIAEAVASALAQTRAPAQVIVVDDGSPDDATAAAIDRLPTGVTVVRVPNGGVAGARNAGIRLLTTRFAAVLDGDDGWEPRPDLSFAPPRGKSPHWPR